MPVAFTFVVMLCRALFDCTVYNYWRPLLDGESALRCLTVAKDPMQLLWFWRPPSLEGRSDGGEKSVKSRLAKERSKKEGTGQGSDY